MVYKGLPHKFSVFLLLACRFEEGGHNASFPLVMEKREVAQGLAGNIMFSLGWLGPSVIPAAV